MTSILDSLNYRLLSFLRKLGFLFLSDSASWASSSEIPISAAVSS